MWNTCRKELWDFDNNEGTNITLIRYKSATNLFNPFRLYLKGYLAAFSKPDLPDELKGKERTVFGNIKQIYEWHKT